MNSFKTLIFDIGNVIIDIDYNVTIAEFQKLAVTDFSQIVSYTQQNRIFDLYETGKISSADFINGLKQFLKPGITNEEIVRAWNSILIHYPPQKIALLKKLKKKYRVIALSNINEIHVNAIDEAARKKLSATKFADFFHHAYYSNEIQLRKPNKEIYDFVVAEQNLKPQETFFVDDKLENIEAAKECGIQAYQLQDRNKLTELLTSVGIL